MSKEPAKPAKAKAEEDEESDDEEPTASDKEFIASDDHIEVNVRTCLVCLVV